MKRALRLAGLAALLLPAAGASPAAAQGPENAASALEDGRSVTAYREILIPAEQGGASARFELGLMYFRRSRRSARTKPRP